MDEHQSKWHVAFSHGDKDFKIDLNKGIDLSIALADSYPQVNCFFAPPFTTQPYRSGDFTGSIAHGSPVNFYNVAVNPHGNGTHTECVGHISREPFYINECYYPAWHLAQVISIFPELTADGDRVITARHLESLWGHMGEDAVIIRTLPNDDGKKVRNYSGSNPPYFTEDAIKYLVAHKIHHLLTDLPSIDREEDDGKLLAHKAFWDYPGFTVRKNCTITELIFVPDHVSDGIYFLNLQFLNMRLDAAPSRPLIYKPE